jgi:hypothetical protein
MMEAVRTSETSVNFFKVVQWHISVRHGSKANRRTRGSIAGFAGLFKDVMLNILIPRLKSLRSRKSHGLSANYPPCMEPKDFLSRFQLLSSGPYPEPDESSPHPRTLFLQGHIEVRTCCEGERKLRKLVEVNRNDEVCVTTGRTSEILRPWDLWRLRCYPGTYLWGLREDARTTLSW